MYCMLMNIYELNLNQFQIKVNFEVDLKIDILFVILRKKVLSW